MENLELENFNLLELSEYELQTIDGGDGFWHDVAWFAGAIIGGLVTMGENARGNPHI